MLNKLFTSAFAIATLFFFASTKSNSQTAPVAAPKMLEKVGKKPGEVAIPYEKWILPNGLIIVVSEDHSDPILYFDVTYHVGSNREQVGRSGFAHFFEHMMFQGSEHVADDEHFKIVSEAGGTLNGSTNTDRTNYFETVPSNNLEKMMWLEADRMGFLLDSVTQQKFEIQRATVKNERGQSYDNRPYGLIFEKTFESLYPYGHPYSWSTIGYLEDLNRVDVGDLKRFFMRWYGPNNATLTVAGDITPAEVVKLAEKYFGPIPRGPEVKTLPKMPAVLDKDRYISYEDNIRFPMLMVTYPSVSTYSADEAAIEALASILADDKNSVFYQNFIKKQLAYEANVFNYPMEVSGTFIFAIKAMPNKSLQQMDSLMKASLAEFEKKGITDEDLKKFKANYEVNTVKSLSSVQGKGSRLAAFQTFTGNPNQVTVDWQRFMKVTKEDVMRVYNQYIKNKPAVYLSVVPKPKEGKPVSVFPVKPNSFDPQKRNPEDGKESAEYKNLSYSKPKDSFARGKKPASGPNPIVKVPELWTENFPNGLKAIGTKNDEIPTVSISLTLDLGHRADALGKSGLAELTSNLLNESTQMHSAEQLSDLLSAMGSSVDISCGDEEIVLSVSTLTKNLDATLSIANEMLFQPKFDKADFDRLKEEQLQTINNQSTQPTVIANNVYRKLLYGKGHILSTPIVGTKESVGSISLDDVKNFYNSSSSPSAAKLVVVGDVSKETLLPKLGFLKSWAAKTVTLTKQPEVPSIDKTRIYFVNKENAAQSEVRIGYIAMPYDATGEYYKTQVSNFVLGGAFNSHINLYLRETKGWTYGARSNFSGTKYPGPFTAAGGIKADATDSSVVAFMSKIRAYADSGITAQELEFTKNSMGLKDALAYETNGQKAGFIKRILDYDLNKDFVLKQQDILKAMTKQDVDMIAKKHLPYNNMVIVVVGDRTKYLGRLKALGYEVVELDADGNQM